jgi:uncharacterized protein YjbI with pentapeptide repeats
MRAPFLQFATVVMLLCFATGARAAEMTAREVVTALFNAPHGSPPDFSGKDLSELDLAGLNFKGARLAKTNLFGADLTASNLTGVNLAGARLDRATIKAAKFDNAEMSGASLLRRTSSRHSALQPVSCQTLPGRSWLALTSPASSTR